MRTSLLAAAAALALAVPAAAQTSQPITPQAPMPVAPPGLGERITSGMQTPEPAFPAAPPATTAVVAPSRLDAAQIRQIQQGLRTQGYAVRRVDGRWGPETAGALQSFQQRQNITGTPGQIDAQTLSQLGVTQPGGTMTPRPGARLGSGIPGTGTGTPGTDLPGASRPGNGLPGAYQPGSGLPQSPQPGTAGQGGQPGFGSQPSVPSGAYGGAMNPPSTPSLDAPGNNGANPPSSIGTPNVTTRPPGARSAPGGGIGGSGSGGSSGGR